MIALLAILVSLASPVAHGPFTLGCSGSWGGAGVAYPAENRVELDRSVCRDASRVIRHKNASPFMAATSIGTLLHEARHIAQYRECGLCEGNRSDGHSYDLEHDANCAAWKALPGTMLRLHYSRRFALKSAREFEPTIQGGKGTCSNG